MNKLLILSINNAYHLKANRAVENGSVFSKGPTGSITKQLYYFPTDITILNHQKKSHKNRGLVKKVITVLKMEIFTLIYIGKRK